MTIEEAIKRCENIRDGAFAVLDSGFGTHDNESPLVYKKRVEFANICIASLRAQAERENTQPLTLEEVKEHITKGHPNDIKPLYVDFKPTIPIDYASRWRDAYNLSRLIAGRGDEYGKTWIAYRSKPKRSE